MIVKLHHCFSVCNMFQYSRQYGYV